MSNDNLDRIDRLFKLWAKICMMISDRKRKAETVSRILTERGLTPDIHQSFWHRSLMAQWHYIVGSLLDPQMPYESGRWNEDREEQICDTLQDILEMKLGKLQTAYVEFRNVMNNPPAYEQLASELGHADFEIVSCRQVSSHHGQGLVPAMGMHVMMPQTAISAIVKYREIQWPDRTKKEPTEQVAQ